MKPPIAPVAVIGAGSWGTALSLLLAQKDIPVRLWARRPDFAAALAGDRRNERYLPGVNLPESIEITDDLAAALAGARMVVLAVPSRGLREICRLLAPLVEPEQIPVSVAKGLEHDTGLRMSQVIGQELPQVAERVVVLSGPNLAAEVAAGIATTTVVAGATEELLREVQAAFMHPTFRVYTNPDLVGVELGGALKHIIAIGAGISDGLGFGDNTKASLVTRGLAEMTRLGAALGACEETFRGLSGLGDLVATCSSSKSRNHHVGYELAWGRTLDEILAGMVMVAEGVPTTRAAHRLAVELKVDMPITEQIDQVLFEGKPPLKAVQDLMMRAGRSELEGA
jgi:glycerol-3-phosphate dehydrogenase (NAD(P)+)